MNQELLDRLQKADPQVYFTYREYIREFGPSDPRREWILQACLQAAIRARKWSYRLIWASSVDICKAFICTGLGVHESVNSDTEAEALCLAYLEAIEAVKG